MSTDRIVAVVPAAGRGDRMGADRNKVYLPLGDRPVIAHTLGVLEACPLVQEIVLGVGTGEEDYCRREVLQPYDIRKVTGIIRGGATRRETVALALNYIGGGAGVIVVHDGARPLLPPGLLLRAVETGRRAGAVTAGLPVGDTVKRVKTTPGAGAADSPDGETFQVVETLARPGLRLIQTPQVFWRDLLEMAHARAETAGEPVDATDDASLVEGLRHPVVVIPGAPENIKITTPLDLVIAGAILAERTRRAGLAAVR